MIRNKACVQAIDIPSLPRSGTNVYKSLFRAHPKWFKLLSPVKMKKNKLKLCSFMILTLIN